MKKTVYLSDQVRERCPGLNDWIALRIGEHQLCSLTAAKVFSGAEPALVIVGYEQGRPWLEDWVVPYPLIIFWARSGQVLPPELMDHPRFHGRINEADATDQQLLVIKSALDRIRDQQHIAEMMDDILEVGRALASEKNLDRLFDLILDHAQKLLNADGASIYTRDKNGKLYFRLWRNASTDTKAEAQKTLVGDKSIAGYVAQTGEPVLLDDAYDIPESAPYTFNPASDRSINYHTRSMLTLPMRNKTDDVVGVLQLINRKREPDARLATAGDCDAFVVSFGEPDIRIAQALAGQAGSALENSILYSDIENLFEGFIKASVQAIEARDPTTAGHSFRVAEFTDRLARAVDRSDSRIYRDIRFDREELREIRFASLLHDFGKVGVRENVLVKSHKLYPFEMEVLKQRFLLARTSFERESMSRIIGLYERAEHPDQVAEEREQIEQLLKQEGQRLDRFLEVVLHANEPAVSDTLASDELQEVAKYRFRNVDGRTTRLLDDFEFACLALAKGSLNEEERLEIESHVTHTFAFLSLIPWTRNLSKLPHIAYGHHEKLDGTGYPLGLSGDEIPIQTRMMTISDIYDALTASDRPYKKSLSPERALDILAAEAGAGKVDGDLFRVFVDSGAHRLIDSDR